ncbi:MAG: DUF2182 domain-containing protein [Hyphomicrobiales bacterium]
MDLVLRQISSRTRVILWTCFMLLILLAAGSLLQTRARFMSWPDFLATLCGPSSAGALPSFAQAFAMWTLMVLSMMLPSAAPMLSTYLDIAEAAGAKRMSVASPFLLVTGYIAVWLSFALAAALLQGMVGPMPSRSIGGGLLIAAGAYQFTPIKHACLSKCRQPMTYFLSNWTDRAWGVFRSGLDLGLLCLGCCWAVMLLAFGGASMNILWMALIGAATILEKTLARPHALVWGIGVGLTAAGAAILAGA